MKKTILTNETSKNLLKDLLKRTPGQYGSYEEAVAGIVQKVKEEGNKALLAYTEQFDGVHITEECMEVTEEEIREA